MKRICILSLLMVLISTVFFAIPAECRYYSPSTGRFLQRDPIAVQGMIDPNPNMYVGNIERVPFNSQFINLYAFVGNNPINRIDPYGLYWGEKHVNWWAYESALPGPYGQPRSEWKCGSPTGWGDPIGYTETAGGGWMWAERLAFGAAVGATGVAIGAGTGVIPNYHFKIGIHGPHHYFPEYGQNLPHIQINRWLPGQKGSGEVWRYPLR